MEIPLLELQRCGRRKLLEKEGFWFVIAVVVLSTSKHRGSTHRRSYKFIRKYRMRVLNYCNISSLHTGSTTNRKLESDVSLGINSCTFSLQTQTHTILRRKMTNMVTESSKSVHKVSLESFRAAKTFTIINFSTKRGGG